jgi:ribosomal protein S6E (S10)
MGNIFSIAGLEVSEAFGLIDADLGYCTSKIDLGSDSKIFKTRLTGGQEMVGRHMDSFFEQEDGESARAMVRDVKIETSIGKIDAIVVDAIDFDSSNYLQVIYPYNAPEDGESLKIHRLKLTGLKGMDDAEKRARMDQFFDGIEESGDFPVFRNRSTNLSVDLA